MTLTLRKFLDLENLKKQLNATESSEFPDKIFAFLSVASVPHNKSDEWKKIVFIFMKAVQDNQPNQNIPIIKDSPNEKGKDVSWDWDGRTWFYWANLFSKSYGWNLETIANLDIDDALALAQEILTEEQLDREFVYSLSEIAYQWNKSLKKSIFKPMPRPYWMKATAPPLKKMKFRREDLPMGIINDVSGMPSEHNPLRDYVSKPDLPAQ